MNPNQKRLLSTALVGLASALVVGLSKVVVPDLPAYAQAGAVAALASLAHYLDTLGHTDRVEAALKAGQ